MLMARIEPELDRNGMKAIRLLRRWAAVRQTDEAVLPSVVPLGVSLGLSAEATVAFASLFELTEACLGRPLETDCCCDAKLSSDGGGSC